MGFRSLAGCESLRDARRKIALHFVRRCSSAQSPHPGRNAPQKHLWRAEIALLTADGVCTKRGHAANGQIQNLRLSLARALHGGRVRRFASRQDAPLAHQAARAKCFHSIYARSSEVNRLQSHQTRCRSISWSIARPRSDKGSQASALPLTFSKTEACLVSEPAFAASQTPVVFRGSGLRLTVKLCPRLEPRVRAKPRGRFERMPVKRTPVPWHAEGGTTMAEGTATMEAHADQPEAPKSEPAIEACCQRQSANPASGGGRERTGLVARRPDRGRGAKAARPNMGPTRSRRRRPTRS